MLTFIASLLLLINVERTKVGVSPLAACGFLQAFANDRANAQIGWNHLDHYVDNELAINSQLSAQHQLLGENLAGWAGNHIPEDINNALMVSELHRKNILEPNFTCVDIGMNDAGNIIAEVFAE